MIFDLEVYHSPKCVKPYELARSGWVERCRINRSFSRHVRRQFQVFASPCSAKRLMPMKPWKYDIVYNLYQKVDAHIIYIINYNILWEEWFYQPQIWNSCWVGTPAFLSRRMPRNSPRAKHHAQKYVANQEYLANHPHSPKIFIVQICIYIYIYRYIYIDIDMYIYVYTYR